MGYGENNNYAMKSAFFGVGFTITVLFITLFGYSNDSYGQVDQLTSNCTISNCTNPLNTCNQTIQDFGAAARCSGCPANTVGLSCEYCSIPQTKSGLPTRWTLDGRFIAKWGMVVGLFTIISVFLAAGLWYWFAHRKNMDNANQAAAIEMVRELREGTNGRNGNKAISAHPAAHVSGAHISNSPVVEPFTAFSILLGVSYIVLFESSHSPTRWNYEIPAYIKGGKLEEMNADCRLYSSYAYLALSLLSIAYSILLGVGGGTIQRINILFSKQYYGKNSAGSTTRADKWLDRVRTAHEQPWQVTLAYTLAAIVAVSALMKMVYDIIFGTRSCCDLLWSSNQTDYVFFFFMALILIIQGAIGVVYLIWYMYASSTDSSYHMRRKHAENYRTITNVQMFGAWADKYYCGDPRPWSFCNFVFNISVAAWWFFFATSLVLFMGGLAWADTTAFQKSRISITEPAMKGDVAYLVVMALWFLRDWIFYAGQTVCMTAECSECRKKKTGDSVDKQREDALNYLAPHREEGKDGKEGREVGLSGARDITEGALLLSSLTASSACNPLTADSFLFCAAKAFKNKLKNPKESDDPEEEDPESQELTSQDFPTGLTMSGDQSSGVRRK
jgi:hypothetical protein